ncbi:MAG: NADH-quinone oxidoreductase subunit C [Nocardioidaceae bacterium]
MSWSDRVDQAYAAALGEASLRDEGFPPLTVEVPADRWVEALAVARDVLGCTFFDWLSAVDEGEGGFAVLCHVVARRTAGVEHLAVRCLLPRSRPVLASAAGVFAGARWHERETHEMFGVDFTDGGALLPMVPLLLPEEFEGHPLRKDFVLASRVAIPWPGAKEPGESEGAPATSRSRRKARPAGVPDPDEWGPR